MLDINEAYKLEELDSYIDEKIESIDNITSDYEFFLRKLNTFVNDMKNKINSFNELVNKEIDDMHNTINSFETSYSQSLNELDNKYNDIIKENDNYNGLYSKEIQANLKKKLEEELNLLINKNEEIMNNYLADYNKALELINKINQRLNKIKSRELKKNI